MKSGHLAYVTTKSIGLRIFHWHELAPVGNASRGHGLTRHGNPDVMGQIQTCRKFKSVQSGSGLSLRKLNNLFTARGDPSNPWVRHGVRGGNVVGDCTAATQAVSTP